MLNNFINISDNELSSISGGIASHNGTKKVLLKRYWKGFGAFNKAYWHSVIFG